MLLFSVACATLWWHSDLHPGEAFHCDKSFDLSFTNISWHSSPLSLSIYILGLASYWYIQEIIKVKFLCMYCRLLTVKSIKIFFSFIDRLPTVAGFSSPSLRTLVRHYSFYSQPESKSPFTVRASTTPHIPKAASLLMHTLALDMNQQESVSSLIFFTTLYHQICNLPTSRKAAWTICLFYWKITK